MPEAGVTSVKRAAGTATAARSGAAGAWTLASVNGAAVCGRCVPRYTSSPASATAPMIQIERRNATPMRRSSASTYSSVSPSAGGGGRSFIGSVGGDRHHRLQDRADLGEVASLALQGVDHHSLGGVIGGRVAQSVQGDRGVAGVVVRFVARVERPFLRRALCIAELRMDQGQVVVRGEVLRIQKQGLFEPRGRLQQKPFALGPALRTTLLLGALDYRLAQLIERDVVLAEVELALACLGEVGRDDVLEIANRLVEPAILLVHQAAEPGHRPGIGRH